MTAIGLAMPMESAGRMSCEELLKAIAGQLRLLEAGPLQTMTLEHQEMRKQLGSLLKTLDEPDKGEIRKRLSGFVSTWENHVEKEEEILAPGLLIIRKCITGYRIDRSDH